MYIYIVNLLTILIYSFFIKDKKKYIIIVSIQLFLILALRNITLGVDLDNYYSGFQYIKTLSLTELEKRLRFFKTARLIYPFDYESGYVVLNWIIAKLGFNFHGFLVILSFIYIYTFGKFIYKYSKIPWLSYVILCSFEFYAYMFGILRQTIALSLFLWIIMLIDDKKTLKAILVFIIAFTMHRAVLVCLPLLLLIKGKKSINKDIYGTAIVMTIPTIILSKPLYYLIVNNIMKLFNKNYLMNSFQISNQIILLVLIAIFIYLCCDFKNLKDSNIIKAFWAIIFACYINILGIYNDVFSRCVQFYSVFLIVVIPYCIAIYKNKKVKEMAKVVTFILLLFFMIYLLRDSIIVPYRIETNNLFFG